MCHQVLSERVHRRLRIRHLGFARLSHQDRRFRRKPPKASASFAGISTAANLTAMPLGATHMIESINAITLATHDMARAMKFYRALGFECIHGGDHATFTSFRAGSGYLNLVVQPTDRLWSWWGRVIFWVSDVDALCAKANAEGYQPDTAPRDAEWGERFFHITDPDGHELSFARLLAAG